MGGWVGGVSEGEGAGQQTDMQSEAWVVAGLCVFRGVLVTCAATVGSCWKVICGWHQPAATAHARLPGGALPCPTHCRLRPLPLTCTAPAAITSALRRRSLMTERSPTNWPRPRTATSSRPPLPSGTSTRTCGGGRGVRVGVWSVGGVARARVHTVCCCDVKAAQYARHTHTSLTAAHLGFKGCLARQSRIAAHPTHSQHTQSTAHPPPQQSPPPQHAIPPTLP